MAQSEMHLHDERALFKQSWNSRLELGKQGREADALRAGVRGSPGDGIFSLCSVLRGPAENPKVQKSSKKSSSHLLTREGRKREKERESLLLSYLATKEEGTNASRVFIKYNSGATTYCQANRICRSPISDQTGIHRNAGTPWKSL